MNVFDLLASPIAFHPILVDLTGDIKSALMLSQLIYWTKRTKDPDGWIYKTGIEWEQETRLSVGEQRLAKKRLVGCDFVQVKRSGMPARLYFRIDKKKLEAKLTLQICQNDSTGSVKTTVLDLSKQQISPYTTYRGTKTTYKDAARRRAAPAGVFLDLGLNGTANTPSTKLATKFHEFVITNRLHTGRKSLKIETWIAAIKNLLKQLDAHPKRVSKVMRWYFDHYKDKYVPKCYAMTTFCDKFLAIEDAMKRDQHEEGEIEIPVDHSEIEDDDSIPRPTDWY